MDLKDIYLSLAEVSRILRGGVKSTYPLEECQWRKQLSGLVLTLRGRRRGDQTGLDTLVVHAVKDDC